MLSIRPNTDGPDLEALTPNGSQPTSFADSTPTTPARPLRVLAVDDELATLEMTAAILGQAGFELQTFSDTDRALNALSEQSAGPDRFDVVLTDLFFGDVARGFQDAEAARALHPPVPVVMLTARPSFSRARDALRSQVAEILVKPTDPGHLIEACRNLSLIHI